MIRHELDGIINSGASFHNILSRDMFVPYRSRRVWSIKMSKEGISNIIGMGNVHIEIDIDYKLVLKNIDMF